LKVRLNATDKDLNNENYQEEKEKRLNEISKLRKAKAKARNEP
jgi:hypothetical protein